MATGWRRAKTVKLLLKRPSLSSTLVLVYISSFTNKEILSSFHLVYTSMFILSQTPSSRRICHGIKNKKRPCSNALYPNPHTRASLRALSPVVGTGFSILKHHKRRSSRGNITKNALLQRNAMMTTKNEMQASR